MSLRMPCTVLHLKSGLHNSQMSRLSAMAQEAMKYVLGVLYTFFGCHIQALILPRVKQERLGAVACLKLAVEHFQIEDHVTVIGGDTLFKEDFSLTQVHKRFHDLQAICEDNCLVLSYQCEDEETRKYGILEVDDSLRVLCMKEKPPPSETTSRRACPCYYMFSKKSLPLLDGFLEEKKNALIEEKDAPGIFVSWLISR